MKTPLTALAALTLAITSTHAIPVQWLSSAGGNDHYYDLTPTTMNWDSAEAFSVSQGGHLVSINSAAEQAFLISAFFAGGNDHLIAWIGLSDFASEGNFVWSSGEAVTFTNWNPGEPNNFGDEDYIAMNWYFGNNIDFPVGTWNDAHNEGTTTPQNPSQTLPYRGIYEVVPEPSVGALLSGLILLFLSIRFRPNGKCANWG